MHAVRSVAGRPRQAKVDRTDLIGCGLIAVAIVLGFAHMLMRSPPSAELTETSRGTVAAEPLNTARLPRTRPDEPVSTSSIGRAAVTSPLPTASGARPDDRSAAEAALEDLRSRAFLIASSSAECDHVVGSDVLQGGAPDDLVISLRCNNGARFYLDREAIRANRIAPPRASAAALAGPEAVRTCEDKLRAGLAVPPSLMRVADSTGIEALSAGETVVSFEADALDGFGAPVFLHVRCEIRGREIARMDVQPR